MGQDLPPELDALFLASPERDRMRSIERAYTMEGDLTAEQRDELAALYGGAERAQAAARRAFADWRDRTEAEAAVERERARQSEAESKAPKAEPKSGPGAGWRTCERCRGKKVEGDGKRPCICTLGIEARPGFQRFADPAMPRTRCNIHSDCDAAEKQAEADGKPPRCGAGSVRLHHCHDEGCEDCFGC